ncbi:MAG: FCD domain-containing protein [Alphaproteobacteria bacterium]|nr:FCD domain-containing protein [Alphaproteobacteria bacterium]
MAKTQDTLQLLRSNSLSSAVQAEIERRILFGEIEAGTRINENSLAAELSISRGPIREACRGLVEMGLLTVIVNRGFFVREITRKEAADVYDVRASLMRLAGETLAQRINDNQLAVLSEMVEGMDAANARDDFEAFYALNREFHERIVDYAENDRLRALCDGLVKELNLYRRRSLLLGGGLAESNQEHKAILTALKDRDVPRAGEEMANHIQAGKRRFLAATADSTRSQMPIRGDST